MPSARAAARRATTPCPESNGLAQSRASAPEQSPMSFFMHEAVTPSNHKEGPQCKLAPPAAARVQPPLSRLPLSPYPARAHLRAPSHRYQVGEARSVERRGGRNGAARPGRSQRNFPKYPRRESEQPRDQRHRAQDHERNFPALACSNDPGGGNESDSGRSRSAANPDKFPKREGITGENDRREEELHQRQRPQTHVHRRHIVTFCFRLRRAALSPVPLKTFLDAGWDDGASRAARLLHFGAGVLVST